MEFIKVATTGEIAPGTALRVEVGDEPVAIFNLDGEFYAIGDICSHAEASLSEGDIYGDIVECPLHGAEFDIKTGRQRTLPAVTPVPTFPVRVEGDDVLLGVGPQE